VIADLSPSLFIAFSMKTVVAKEAFAPLQIAVFRSRFHTLSRDPLFCILSEAEFNKLSLKKAD
jgi:hypothetical protein